MSYRNYRTVAVAVSCTLLAIACALPKPKMSPGGRITIFAGDPLPRLEFDAPGLLIAETRSGGAGQYVFGNIPDSGVALSASIEQQTHYGDCRDYHWSRVQKTPGFKADRVQRREIGELEVIEYVLAESIAPEAAGVRIDQKNIIGCVRRDSVDAYVHVSKVQYHSEDDAPLEAVMKSVRLVTK